MVNANGAEWVIFLWLLLLTAEVGGSSPPLLTIQVCFLVLYLNIIETLLTNSIFIFLIFKEPGRRHRWLRAQRKSTGVSASPSEEPQTSGIYFSSFSLLTCFETVLKSFFSNIFIYIISKTYFQFLRCKSHMINLLYSGVNLVIFFVCL